MQKNVNTADECNRVLFFINGFIVIYIYNILNGFKLYSSDNGYYNIIYYTTITIYRI